MDVIAYRVSISFAIVTGSTAGVLALLSGEVLRESPYGKGIELLAVAMSMATVYHAGLLVLGSETPTLQTILVGGYLLVPLALFVGARRRADVASQDGVFGHGTVLVVTVAGSLLFAVGGPLSAAFVPTVLHWVHGFAALVTVAGVYAPVHDDLREDPWTGPYEAQGSTDQDRADWMLPIDDAILETLQASGLVLTPAVVAYNIEYSRKEVNRRLTRLDDERLVDRVARGKYRITDRGTRYVEGGWTMT